MFSHIDIYIERERSKIMVNENQDGPYFQVMRRRWGKSTGFMSMGHVLQVKLGDGYRSVYFVIYLYALFNCKSMFRQLTEKKIEITFTYECIAYVIPCTKYTLKQ